MTSALLALFTLMQIADGVTTYIGIKRGAYEQNPAVAWLMDRLGLVPGLAIAKGLAVIAAWLIVKHTTTAGAYILGVLCAGYAILLMNNVRMIARLRG